MGHEEWGCLISSLKQQSLQSMNWGPKVVTAKHCNQATGNKGNLLSDHSRDWESFRDFLQLGTILSIPWVHSLPLLWQGHPCHGLSESTAHPNSVHPHLNLTYLQRSLFLNKFLSGGINNWYVKFFFFWKTHSLTHNASQESCRSRILAWKSMEVDYLYLGSEKTCQGPITNNSRKQKAGVSSLSPPPMVDYTFE